MHQLTASLYQLMVGEGFLEGSESYQAFFIRMVQEGKLQHSS